MSPFLENWYPQTTCNRCGEPIMFENKVPLQSDGTDHREGCERSGFAQTQRFQEPKIPEKPSNHTRALEWEVLHGTQSSLEAFSKTHKKLYPERYAK